MNTPQYAVPQSNPNKSTAIILEIVPAIFFGIFGIGWLYSGKTTPGVILLICGIIFIWGGYAAILLGATVFTTITLGLGVLVYCCVCIVPLIQLLGAVLSTVMLNNSIK